MGQRRETIALFVLIFLIITLVKQRACTELPKLYNVAKNINTNMP